MVWYQSEFSKRRPLYAKRRLSVLRELRNSHHNLKLSIKRSFSETIKKREKKTQS